MLNLHASLKFKPIKNLSTSKEAFLNIADLPILTRNRFISSGLKEKLCSRKVIRIATASTSKMVALKMRVLHYTLASC